MSSRPANPVVLDDAYFPLKRLAAYAGICERQLRTYTTHPVHPLPVYRIGGRVLVRKSDYDAWALQFRQVPDSRVDALVQDALHGR